MLTRNAGEWKDGWIAILILVSCIPDCTCAYFLFTSEDDPDEVIESTELATEEAR